MSHSKPLTAVSGTDQSVQSALRTLEVGSQGIAALASSLQGPLGAAFAEAIALIRNARGRVIVAGLGKSGHVARKVAATLASTGTPSFFVHAAEASHGDLGMVGPEDAVLAVSKSGETRELADLLAYCKRFGIPLLAMTARADSALGRAADMLLLLPEAPEATDGVDAPTTSTTLQIALGDALAVALLERRGFTALDFRVFHPGGKLGAALRTAGHP